jgi:hypothetical protein
MARPHILFVQAQFLPWDDGVVGGARTDVKVKTLSHDSENGGSSLILRYPKGWRRDEPEILNATEEFFVLDGILEINGRSYGRHAYANLPAGYVRQTAGASEGATVLTFFDREPHLTKEAETAVDAARLVEHIDTLDMPWVGGAEGSVTGKPLSHGIETKKLRVDPDTAEQSFLYTAQPQHGPPGIMKGKFGHPMIEEIFTLSGTYVFADAGVMGPGGYCWWRENEFHGPAGSLTGYNLFIRVIGGPLRNIFSDEPFPFTFTPKHNPSLPDDFKPYGQPYPYPAEY